MLLPPVFPAATRRERALDLLFPPLCVGCRHVGRWICERCWPRVLWLGPHQPDPVQPSALDCILAVSMFDGVAREAVHALKFEERHAIGGMMGRLMAEHIRDRAVDVISPVPLHPARRRERGYDQARILAAQVARSLGLPCRANLLRRTRRTEQQTALGASARRENMRGAFEARERSDGLHVVLVDDVYTTGATMDSAAEAVRAAGATAVTGLVFGRAR